MIKRQILHQQIKKKCILTQLYFVWQQLKRVEKLDLQKDRRQKPDSFETISFGKLQTRQSRRYLDRDFCNPITEPFSTLWFFFS